MKRNDLVMGGELVTLLFDTFIDYEINLISKICSICFRYPNRISCGNFFTPGANKVSIVFSLFFCWAQQNLNSILNVFQSVNVDLIKLN